MCGNGRRVVTRDDDKWPRDCVGLSIYLCLDGIEQLGGDVKMWVDVRFQVESRVYPMQCVGRFSLEQLPNVCAYD